MKDMKRKHTAEHLESYIREDWDNIPLPKLQQLVSSVPRCLESVITRRGDAIVVSPVSTFSSIAVMKFKMS